MRIFLLLMATALATSLAQAKNEKIDGTDRYHAHCQKLLTSRLGPEWLKAEMKWLSLGEPVTHKLWSKEAYLTPLQAVALGLDPTAKIPAGRLRVKITTYPDKIQLNVYLGSRELNELILDTQNSRTGYLYYDWDRDVLNTTPVSDLARSSAIHLLTRQVGAVTLGYTFNSEYDIYRRAMPPHADAADDFWLEVSIVRPCPGRPGEMDDFLFPVKGTDPLDLNLCLTQLFTIDGRNQYRLKRPRVGAKK